MTHKARRAGLIASIRAGLERRAATLGRALDRELGELGDDRKEHHLSDVDDLAGDAGSDETAFALLELEGLELEQLRWAVRRIDDGSYGICEDCGGEIPEKRLLALPIATRCVECQRVADRAGGETEGPSAREAAVLERRLASVEDVVEKAERNATEE